jgi:hypothetical protein
VVGAPLPAPPPAGPAYGTPAEQARPRLDQSSTSEA